MRLFFVVCCLFREVEVGDDEEDEEKKSWIVDDIVECELIAIRHSR